MPTVMTDNRRYIAMTADQADALFAELAQAEIECAAIEAAAETRIAEIKRSTEAATAAKRELVKRRASELERYIDAHRADFVSPRARKTSWGSYGLRTVSGVQITADAELLRYAIAHELTSLVIVKTSLDRKAVEEAARRGDELPGVAIVSGERSFYKTAKALLDRAKTNAQTVEELTR